MTIGLISDTHGWLDPAIEHWFSGIDLILHAGDVGREKVLHQLEQMAPTVAVRGNIDGGVWGRELPLEEIVYVKDKKMALLHIAGTPKKPRPEARRLIRQHQPTILLTGHTHIPVIERRSDVLWINPGAAGIQGSHRERTVMLLHITDKMRVEFITLGARTMFAPLS